MAELGRALLILALACSLYGAAASVRGATLVGPRAAAWTLSGRRSVWVLAGLLTLAFAILESAFLRSDFHFDLVASYSSTTTPTFYKATAVWSSQPGSLLLWVWLLSLWSSLALATLGRRRLREVAPWATAVLLGLAAFFCALLVFTPDAHPFSYTAGAAAPVEGNGLNPLLRHPSMMFHPPLLYSGYTLSAIPFAFALGALIAGRLGSDWLRATRRFALLGWLFLGFGILLGARWSYSELGWGGYWAWDAVENASLLPWLCGTAFLHSAMIQERRGMLKVWNVSLVLATGILAVMGTFLVRSGILDSIHAFGGSTLGGYFLALLAVMIGSSVVLVVLRRGDLRSEHRLDSLLSREAMFLGQNLVLVAMAFAVWWGTFFPLISEAITGTRHSLGPPWFDQYTVPLALVLVLLTGIGPIIAWRRSSPASLRRSFRAPALIGVAALAGLAATGASRHVFAWLMFGCAAFAVGCVGQELWRGTAARRVTSGEPLPRALVSLVRRNRRRYAGYLVHVGMALLFVGVAASSSFKHTRDVSLLPGQSARVGDYSVRYVRPVTALSAEKISLGAVLDITRGAHHVATLTTTRGYYRSRDPTLGPLGRSFEGEATSEVGLRAGAGRDVWTVINPDVSPLKPLIAEGDRKFGRFMRDAAQTRNPRALIPTLLALRDSATRALTQRWISHPWAAEFRLIVSPLVTWIWIGGLVVALGGLLAVWPAPAPEGRRVRAGYKARLGRELAGRAAG